MLLDTIAKKPNIKARIQALKALLYYRRVDQLGGPKMLPIALDTIAECLNYKTRFRGSTAELNYLEVFEDGFLDFWQSVSAMLRESETEPEIHGYLNSNSTFLLLQSVTDYLRRELKVPQYSGTFASEAEFAEDTERLFSESPGGRLEQKIGKIKSALQELLRLIDEQSEIKVSFSAFEGIKSLAESEVRQYRGLRVLQEIKSSFIPSFADNNTVPEE